MWSAAELVARGGWGCGGECLLDAAVRDVIDRRTRSSRSKGVLLLLGLRLAYILSGCSSGRPEA